jgi:hypothetical protein
MSINTHGHIIDDASGLGIVLNDNVTLMDGYVEVKDGKAFQWFSDDPNNGNPKVQDMALKNRVHYRRGELLEDCKETALQGKHFRNRTEYEEYRKNLK